MSKHTHLWHDIQSNKGNDIYTAVIEIPEGSFDKYELNKETGTIEVDRQVSISYPYSYGFIPITYSEDGDPLDVFYLGPDRLKSGDIKDVVIFGGIDMLDNQERDVKVLAMDLNVDVSTQRLYLSNVLSFLNNYKPPGKVKVLRVLTKKETIEEIENSKKKYDTRFKKWN